MTNVTVGCLPMKPEIGIGLYGSRYFVTTGLLYLFLTSIHSVHHPPNLLLQAGQQNIGRRRSHLDRAVVQATCRRELVQLATDAVND